MTVRPLAFHAGHDAAEESAGQYSFEIYQPAGL